MIKHLHILFAVLLILSLIACTTPAAATPTTLPTAAEPTATMTPPEPAATPPAAVTFTDPVLEEMVRGAMGKPEGVITVAEAAAVTRLNLNNEWQQYISMTPPVQDISGLENFTNLEFLDLSSHAVRDISPLAGLTKLTWLSLGGNPVADVTPLAGLTNLKGLDLSGSTAHDYGPLAALVNLEFLRLDHSTITDVSPLASLMSLKYLYLADSPVSDYYVLETLYPNLADRDFTIAFTLEELGFAMSAENHEAKYASESLDVIINHIEWGAPPMEWDANCVRMSLQLEDGYTLKAIYYPDLDAYAIAIGKDGELTINYVYDTAIDNISFEDRESLEPVVLAAMDVAEDEDVLFAPVRLYRDAIQATFSMTADTLYTLPFGPPTLRNLGFFPDEVNAVWHYEQRDGKDVNIEIHHPEWGELDYDFRFFTPLSDEYRIVITYHSGERKFAVGADDNDLGGADFEFFIETQEHIDGWCSDKNLTVGEYFIKAFNDPAVTDVYLHSVELVTQYVAERFGMTLDELMALPTGE